MHFVEDKKRFKSVDVFSIKEREYFFPALLKQLMILNKVLILSLYSSTKVI